MKIDFSAVIKDLDGDAVKGGEKDATFGRVACSALLASYADEQNLPAEDKVKRFRLAEVASKGGEQEMKVDDVALIKTLIGKAFAPLVVGRAYDIIEPPLCPDRHPRVHLLRKKDGWPGHKRVHARLPTRYARP
jgi:hypothetical protein